MYDIVSCICYWLDAFIEVLLSGSYTYSGLCMPAYFEHCPMLKPKNIQNHYSQHGFAKNSICAVCIIARRCFCVCLCAGSYQHNLRRNDSHVGTRTNTFGVFWTYMYMGEYYLPLKTK